MEAGNRGFWFAVILVYLAGFVVVGAWAVEAGNLNVLWWCLVLFLAAYLTWLNRANQRLVRWAAFGPILVIILTGLLGRWPNWR